MLHQLVPFRARCRRRFHKPRVAGSFGELRKPDPDKGVISERLERFTGLLGDVGHARHGGREKTLIRPIRGMRHLVGPDRRSLIGSRASRRSGSVHPL